MKKKVLVIFVILLVGALHSVTILLDHHGILEGEIKNVTEKKVYLFSEDVLAIIDKDVIKTIKRDLKVIQYKDLLAIEYNNFNLKSFKKVIKINKKTILYDRVSSFARTSEEYMIVFDSGRARYDKFKVKTSLMGMRMSYLLMENGTEVSLSEVKIYKNIDGYFQAIPNKIDPENISILSPDPKFFARRVINGKIDLFTKVIESFTPGSSTTINTPGGATTINTMGSSVSTRLDYFRKGNGSLKKATYKNLKGALQKNSESMKFLVQYNKINKISLGISSAGLAVVLFGVYQRISESSSNYNVMISGGVIMGIGQLIGLGKRTKIEEAIDAYNK